MQQHTTRVTVSKAMALLTVDKLVRESRWFECTPLPMDKYELTFKREDPRFQLPEVKV